MARAAAVEADAASAYLASAVVDIHTASRGSYGMPRVRAELRLGLGVAVSRKRVAGLVRLVGRAGIGANTHRKRRKRPMPAPHEDRVQRRFAAEAPNRLWCTDVTEHPAATGKIYCCAVLDVFSRQIVGWSIADHIGADLVVDALQMATWRRRPEPGGIVHSDRGSVGGLNRSSQHLVINGGVGWCGGSSRRIGRCDQRCVHRDDRSRPGMWSGSSGG